MRFRILPVIMLATPMLFLQSASHAQCTINCPATITQVADPGVCGANVSFTATSDCGALSFSKPSGSFFPVGTTMVTVSSISGPSCSFSVTVTDNQSPVISNLSASPNMLWPPNHKMRDIQVNYTSTDNCAVTGCMLTVTSNEPTDGLGDGDTEVDWEILSANKVRLRSERSGLGTGRVYTITATCRDAAGNTTSQSTTVTVPHDMGKGGSNKAFSAKAVNSGVNYFTILLESNGSSEKISMLVTDSYGRVIESKPNIGSLTNLQFGHNYRPGVYHVSLVQGAEKVSLKLVK